MKRAVTDYLKTWLNSIGRKPLLLRGARQVGKSTAVRLFAQEAGLDLVEINLEQHRDLDRLFATLDVENILLNLAALTGKSIHKGTLLFLDEIQAVPMAVACLRYFHENRPELPLIAAGSLLEFTLSEAAFSMPVGRVQYLYMQPMRFSEFLAEVDAPALGWLQSLEPGKPFPEQAHKRLTERQRQYMLVGGMPEAVQRFSQTGDYDAVASVQRSILNTYIDDFAKYARQKDLAELQRLFRNLPLHLGQKVKYTRLLPDTSSLYSRRMLDLLFLDVGLVTRLLGQDLLDIQHTDERTLVNEGPLAEQFIGQHLALDSHYETMPELFYWLNQGKNTNAEIDFVVAQGRLLVPLDVKAGKTGTLKSLHYFCGIRQLDYAVRFDLSMPSLQLIDTSISGKDSQPIRARYRLFSLPLYAVEHLPSLLQRIRSGEVHPAS
jgi:uncharacterized protein